MLWVVIGILVYIIKCSDSFSGNVAYFYVNVFLFSKEVLWIIPNRLMCWPLIPRNQRLDYSCARLEKLNFYHSVEMWAAMLRAAWTWHFKETAKLAQDFSKAIYTSSEIQNKADHCLWRVSTEDADICCRRIKSCSHSLGLVKVIFLYALNPAISLQMLLAIASHLCLIATLSWIFFNKIGCLCKTPFLHWYSAIHTLVSKDFVWTVFGKEAENLNRRIAAYCNSADIDVAIPLAFTQALWILGTNAKGKEFLFLWSRK